MMNLILNMILNQMILMMKFNYSTLDIYSIDFLSFNRNKTKQTKTLWTFIEKKYSWCLLCVYEIFFAFFLFGVCMFLSFFSFFLSFFCLFCASSYLFRLFVPFDSLLYVVNIHTHIRVSHTSTKLTKKKHYIIQNKKKSSEIFHMNTEYWWCSINDIYLYACKFRANGR